MIDLRAELGRKKRGDSSELELKRKIPDIDDKLDLLINMVGKLVSSVKTDRYVHYDKEGKIIRITGSGDA